MRLIFADFLFDLPALIRLSPLNPCSDFFVFIHFLNFQTASQIYFLLALAVFAFVLPAFVVAELAALAVTFVIEFVFTTIAVLDATLVFTVFTIVFTLALTFASVFELASVGGAVSVGVSAEVVCKTDTFPVSAGNESNNAESINTVAATIVIFDKIVCEPRGWNAVLEILLVKSAPAPVFPGCSKTLATSKMQEIKNNVYKI